MRQLLRAQTAAIGVYRLIRRQSTRARLAPNRRPRTREGIRGSFFHRLQGPPAWPLHDDEVFSALAAAYHDGSWGKYHGAHVEKLEEALCRYHGVPHAVTCSSGTIAVELALRGLKIGPGDDVILAGYDY